MCLTSGLWWSWLVGVLFLWAYYPPAIEYEDRKLHRIFGAAWEAWSSGVPALAPRSLSVGSLAAGHWSFTKSLRQNAEPLVIVWVLFWLYWLWRQLPQ
jgi:protein-S-isoprenylcysteine O-methyltransferase Ste14